MKYLYRSHSNRILAGVCGGLGHYFNIDAILIRLVWLLLILFGGTGLILYIIAWLIIPAEPEVVETSETEAKTLTSTRARFWWGLTLVIMGVILWGGQFRFIYWPVIPGLQLHSHDFVPFVLLLVGVYLLYTFGRSSSRILPSGERGLYRSRDNKKIGGVCGGIAEYFQIDPTLVRVLFVAGSFFYLAGVLIYLVLLIALPEKPVEPAAKPRSTTSSRTTKTKGEKGSQSAKGRKTGSKET